MEGHPSLYFNRPMYCIRESFKKDRFVCVCVCVFIKLHITAQSGPVIYSLYATVCNPPGGYLS